MAKKNYGKTASGKPIADDLIDRLAKKAEGGYDVEETLRRRRGQPTIGSAPATGGVRAPGPGAARGA